VQYLQSQIKEYESSLSTNPLQALKNAEILLQNSPQSVKFKLLEGKALLAANRYVDLREKMSKVTDAQDDMLPLLSLKGMAEYYLSNFTVAIQLFEG
jgi:predicted Zn-dependent protease